MLSAQAPAESGTLAGSGQPGLALRWALLICLAGGVILALAFPPYGIWPLAVAGPCLLVLALGGRSLRGSLLCGLVFGAAFFFPLLSWLINVAWYALLSLALALTVFFAVLTVGQRLLLHLRYWPVAVAGWWVTAEGVRDRWPFPFPWGRLAMSQAGSPAAGWMAIGGAPLLTFLLALTGAMIARAVLAGTARPRPSHAWLAAVLTVLAVSGIACAPLDPVGHAPTAQVAAIQGNVPRARNLPQQLNDTEVTQNHAGATLKLAGEVKAGKLPAPDVVLWPENSTDLDPFENPAIYAEIANAVLTIGRPILVGEVLQGSEQLNVGQLWTPKGGPGPMYIKRQLVPFGEYIPWRGFISSFSSLPTLQPQNFTAGTKPVVLTVGKIRLGDVICYEVGFDPLVRSEVTAGANLLTVQSNDADFEIDGQSGESGQQVAMARLRAIESDRSVVYVSTTGESAIIAPDGQVIMNSGLWRQAILEARVPLVTYRTLADRIGQWPEYAIIAFTVASLLVALSLVTGIGSRRPGSMRWVRVS
ncbi:MAG TPA: apolipoprotein N-acyltransferase [Streptosporangiaceae bacterium]|jgi:apolipoprotein N-acyltransferase